MALVSYVDILEVVGDLKDFKAKLVEGERIAQSGGITKLAVKENNKGVFDITASCQSSTENSSFLVSISVVCEPRILDCKCSCLEGKSGKCQHVVAALMHIHRTNISAETLNYSEPGSTELCDGSSTTITNLAPKQPNTEEMVTDPPGNSVKVIEQTTDELKEESAKCTAIADSDCDRQQRLGRGQRKIAPNPKYISENNRFLCQVCAKAFGKKAHYEEHLRSHTGEKPFVCDVCGQRYSQKRSLLKHMENHKEDSSQTNLPLKCNICDYQCQHQSDLDSHLLSHRSRGNGGPPPSEEDGLVENQTLKNLNVDLPKSDCEFTCEICGKQFKKLAFLTQHKRTHTEDKPFKCSECGKCFSRERTFKAHSHKTGKSPSLAPLPKARAVTKCEVCGKEFTNRVHHEEHMRSHTGERPFQCVVCGKGFASKRSLRNHSHMRKSDRDRPHMCSQCPAAFTTAFMLKIHERGHTDERPYVCSECGKAYRSQHVYQDHLNHHKGIKAHNCKECGKSFTWRTSLWVHMKEHAKEKPFECIQCGAKFSEQSELKDHWEVHLDDKPFQCPECGLGFMLEVDCDKHVEIHKQAPSYSCTKCDEKFISDDDLNRHKQTHIEKKRSLCPTCGQTFSSKGHLKVHMLIHTGEKPFECEICHKRFYTRSLMRKHAVFHSNERPFECALCGDKFPTQGILKAHVRTHTGERPFICEECGKSFPQSSYLKRHMLTHTGERPHPCPDCDNSFTSRYDLKIHLRTHTGERPYSCDECDESFYERAQLTAHLRTHTGEKPHVCDLCGKGFNSSNHIKKHFGRVHRGVAPFYCTDCGKRFKMCEALRKHRKSAHLAGTDTAEDMIELSENSNDARSEHSLYSQSDSKDPLKRLIRDSKILVDDETSISSNPVDPDDPPILSQECEIVHVNLVDSLQILKLPDGFRCETVQVYQTDPMSSFEDNEEFEAVRLTTLPEEIEVSDPSSPIVVDA